MQTEKIQPAHGSPSTSAVPADPAAKVVGEFVDRFNQSRIDAAMELLAEDVFYHNIPLEPLRGREAVRAFTRNFGVGTQLIAEWRIINIAVQGEYVLTERVDAFRTADNRRISIPLMGVFRVVNHLITEWRDYFDLAGFTKQLEALNPPPGTR